MNGYRLFSAWICLTGLFLFGIPPGVMSEQEFAFILQPEEEEEQSPWERLTEREDEIQTEDPLVIAFLNRPLVLSGQYEAVVDYIDRLPVGTGSNSYGRLLFEQELEAEAFYAVTPAISAFFQLRFAMEEDLLSETPEDVSDRFIERGEMWVNWAGIAGSPVSLEVGRLDFEDDRLWWWDEDLDAARLIYEADLFEIALAVAEELAPARSDRSYIDPEHENLTRWIAEISLDWNDHHALQLFVLHQNDRSGTEAPGAVIASDREDESDAELTWLGVRAAGAFVFEGGTLLGYWADAGRVLGRETLLETEDVPPKYVEVDEVVRKDVSGWGVDTGLTLALPTAGEPRFTLGWAWGSGDRRTDSGTDSAYRQTGIHGNECAFGGVERFQIYGEILDPELSNISIVTAGLGFSLMESSSIDLVLHDYRLVQPAGELRDSRLDAELNESDLDLGSGVDLILGLEEWDAVQFRITASAFHTGKAFGVDRDQWIYSTLFEFRFAF